jgi:hypothetical protein
MKKLFLVMLAMVASISGSEANAGIVIGGYMANPAGTDGNNEYVQLVATSNINFSSTPWSVVWANNGTATVNGWAAGGSLTYGFDITSGAVNAGDTFYVGGTGQLLNGAGSPSLASLTWLRSIAVATTAGDGFGSSNSAGVMGNGGSNADGIGVFSGLASSLTGSSTPFDAVFYGAGLGGAVVAGGTDGYVLPSNDLFSGGFLGSTGNTALFGDPASGNFTKLTGTFDSLLGTWTAGRTSAISTPTLASDLRTGITITAVPEPTALLMVGMAVVGCVVRRRRIG